MAQEQDQDQRLDAAEQPAGEAAGSDAADPAELAARIAGLEQQLAALKDELLRARADADNIRKRAQRDVEAAHRFGLERFVNDLLPVKDSMDLGLDAAASATSVEALREGIQLTVKLLGDALDRAGVRVVDPQGEKFNPELHQAMGTQESAGQAPGTVLRVMQRGYALNDRLVRPALVIVARQGLDTQA